MQFDPAPFIKETKLAIRKNSNVGKHFQKARDKVQRQVQALVDARAKAHNVVPELHYSAIRDGKVSSDDLKAIRQHGSVIVRGVFDKQQAVDWNQELGEYLDNNQYYDKAKEKAGLDNYFGDLKDARPQIFGVYWSRPQVMARQAESMAKTLSLIHI